MIRKLICKVEIGFDLQASTLWMRSPLKVNIIKFILHSVGHTIMIMVIDGIAPCVALEKTKTSEPSVNHDTY